MQPSKSEVGALSDLVGENITRYRKAANFTMRGLAQALTDNGFPTSNSVISQIENGKRRVTVEDLERLAFILKCPVIAFLLPHTEDAAHTFRGESARSIVHRVVGPIPEGEEWLQEEISKANGTYWDGRAAGIGLVESVGNVMNLPTFEDIITFSRGHLERLMREDERGDD